MELKISPVSFKARIALDMPVKNKKQNLIAKSIQSESNTMNTKMVENLHSKLIAYFTKIGSKLVKQVKLPS